MGKGVKVGAGVKKGYLSLPVSLLPSTSRVSNSQGLPMTLRTKTGANQDDWSLYIGLTDNLSQRVVMVS